MTARERVMALAAISLIFVFGGAVLGWQFVLRPIQQKDKLKLSLTNDIDNDQFALQEFEKNKAGLKLMKKMSLPANVDDARSKYSEELQKMLRNAKFAADQYSVNPKQLERLAGGPAAKKPPFTRLQFDVTAHGTEENLVDFLSHFYSTPLLHRIRTLNIQRSLTATTTIQPGMRGGAEQRNILDVTLLIEALIVDGAEDRKTLLPEGITPPKHLARGDDKYATIAHRDIFFGPARVTTTKEVDPEKVDAMEWISFDGVFHTPSGSTATLYEALHNYWFEIYCGTDGKATVRTYWYRKDKKEYGPAAQELIIKGDQGEELDRYKIERIDGSDLLMSYEDTFYRLHMGEKLSEVHELKTEEAKKLRLPVKEKTAEKKEVGKPVMVEKK
ncbi:MAG: hypothetical protein ACJ8F7_23505 [Gemmataceae bacterium]